MQYIIAVLGQKGGVGKSSLAQLIAQGYARAEYAVLLADMDEGQQSSVKWSQARMQNSTLPTITVKAFNNVAMALKESEAFSLCVFDGAPHATAQTKEIAKHADLILLPCNTSRYDMDPQINLAHELVRSGIEPIRIQFVLSRIVATKSDLAAAYAYIKEAGYSVCPDYLEEKTGYRQAAEQGRALTETIFKSLAARSQGVFGGISTSLLKAIQS